MRKYVWSHLALTFFSSFDNFFSNSSSSPSTRHSYCRHIIQKFYRKSQKLVHRNQKSLIDFLNTLTKLTPHSCISNVRCRNAIKIYTVTACVKIFVHSKFCCSCPLFIVSFGHGQVWKTPADISLLGSGWGSFVGWNQTN